MIAADGASSRFASQAGVRRDPAKPLGIAARRYYRVERRPGPWLEVWMDLREGDDTILPGYGWLFPLADGSINVGAGPAQHVPRLQGPVGAAGVRRVLADASRRVERERELRRGPGALGAAADGLLADAAGDRPGMLVVGDAAGMVNPFNGEGIAYAMESGELAAELIHEALVKDRPGIAHLYPTELRERYGRYYRIGSVFVRAIGHPPVMRALTEYALPREWLMRFMLRLMGNLTDGRTGDTRDKIMYALERIVPAS